MKNKWNAIGLGGLLTLSFLVTKPVMADEWNKKTEFQFNAPVEIPGRVLTPGRYVFEIAESQTERSMVEVFSEDSNGKENLIATLMAIPDRTLNTRIGRSSILKSGVPRARRRFGVGFTPERILVGSLFIPNSRPVPVFMATRKWLIAA